MTRRSTGHQGGRSCRGSHDCFVYPLLSHHLFDAFGHSGEIRPEEQENDDRRHWDRDLPEPGVRG